MWRCACLLALLCAALARCSALKRAEMSPVPFVLGSRYGRSPPRMIAPRNDRFFMGSRYGKRADAAEAAEAAEAAVAAEALALRPQAWPARCDCSPYARHSLARDFYNRRLDAPERVLSED